MEYPHKNKLVVNVIDHSQQKSPNRSGCLLSTTACVCLILGFVCTIIITSSLTYALAYDAYYLNVGIERKADVSPPLVLIPTPNGNATARGDIRLPTALRPIQYLIKLQPFISVIKNFTVTGYEEMSFYVEEVTDQVIFHIKDITIDESSITLSAVNGSSSNKTKFIEIEYDDVRQFFIGTVSHNLEKDVVYNMSMDFTGYLNDNLVGFYRSVYQDEEGEDTYLATTQFEPTDARRAFPCFDEPALKARFEIHVLREGARRRTISNMPRIETYEANEPWTGWYWDVFQNSLPMSSYLVAFVVSDFLYQTSDENIHVSFRVWAREEALYQAEYALDIGPEVLMYYEEFFNISFPLPKQDMVALPDFDAGAMENWGLITYRETALLYDSALGSAVNKQRVGVVVAHELAHQWFGDLVSPEWWTYLWLNEGFASYMEYYGLDAVEPSFGMLDQFFLDNNLYALAVDCLESSHPIEADVQNPNEINELFDTISYNKGAAVIRMMEFFLTRSTFQKGLTNYLNGLAYSSATSDDLWEYLTEQGHDDKTLPDDLDVKRIMDTWTLQMGYPLITVQRHQTNYTIKQKRFLLTSSNSNDELEVEDDPTYRWYVPVTYTTQDNPNFMNTYPSHYLTDKENSKIIVTDGPGDGNWFLFNIQSGGFYRVNYGDNNWKNLFGQLSDDYEVIGITNRAQIIDDAMNIARAGIMTYTLALDSTNYLGSEIEYVPWYTALTNLNYLEEMFTRTSGYGGIKRYILSLLTPFYESLGFDDHLNDTHLDQMSRSLILTWACHLDYDSCVDDSVALYDQWMESSGNQTIISPNLKSTVFCTGIAKGDEKEWDFAYNQYLTSNYGSDKEYLLGAMGCSQEIWILERYLNMAFTDEYGIRKQDSYKVFDSVAKNDIGRNLAWDYLVTYWDDIAEFYGSDTAVADLALYASNEFNTQEEQDEVIALRKEHEDDLGTATQSLDQAIENIGNNIAWMTNYYDEINQYLIDGGFGDL